MFLVDTNVFLEILLRQDKKEMLCFSWKMNFGVVELRKNLKGRNPG